MLPFWSEKGGGLQEMLIEVESLNSPVTFKGGAVGAVQENEILPTNIIIIAEEWINFQMM